MEQQRSTTAVVPLASTDTNESNLEKRLTLLKGNTFAQLAAISEPSPGDEPLYDPLIDDIDYGGEEGADDI